MALRRHSLLLYTDAACWCVRLQGHPCIPLRRFYRGRAARPAGAVQKAQQQVRTSAGSRILGARHAAANIHAPLIALAAVDGDVGCGTRVANVLRGTAGMLRATAAAAATRKTSVPVRNASHIWSAADTSLRTQRSNGGGCESSACLALAAGAFAFALPTFAADATAGNAAATPWSGENGCRGSNSGAPILGPRGCCHSFVSVVLH